MDDGSAPVVDKVQWSTLGAHDATRKENTQAATAWAGVTVGGARSAAAAAAAGGAAGAGGGGRSSGRRAAAAAASASALDVSVDEDFQQAETVRSIPYCACAGRVLRRSRIYTRAYGCPPVEFPSKRSSEFGISDRACTAPTPCVALRVTQYIPYSLLAEGSSAPPATVLYLSLRLRVTPSCSSTAVKGEGRCQASAQGVLLAANLALPLPLTHEANT